MIGKTVHYVSHGSPVLEDGTQRYPSVCRPAVITEMAHPDRDDRSAEDAVLLVQNPSGIFFDTCPHDEVTMAGGTWHWPELPASYGSVLD
jgi:hypothetical protein